MQATTFTASYRRPRALSVDGIGRQPAAPEPRTYLHAQTARSPVTKPADVAVAKPKRSGRLQPLLWLGGSLVAGLFVQALWFGMGLAIVYGILAVLFRVKSSITFALAIIAFLSVVVLMTTRPDSVLANNFAAYAFLLLTIGVISLMLEVRPGAKWKRHRGR